MNDEVYEDLLEASWRRKLTAEEEAQLRAWLAAHPEAQGDWEEESLLNQQLERLPQSPLASNFTSQVMRKLDLELAQEARERRGWRTPGWWRSLMPRFAAALLLTVLGGTAVFQYRDYRRTQMFESVSRLTPVAAVLQPEIAENFDAIQQLRHVPSVSDEELLAALQ
jgi:anti-sigma factor RsiW